MSIPDKEFHIEKRRNMTEAKFDYPNSDHGEIVELPEEKSYREHPILSAEIGTLPLEVERRLAQAHFHGHLKDSLAHWTGALTGAEIIDKATVNTLNELSGEISGRYLDDKPVLDKIRQVFISLRTKKR
jgi:hypothetical protein